MIASLGHCSLWVKAATNIVVTGNRCHKPVKICILKRAVTRLAETTTNAIP